MNKKEALELFDCVFEDYYQGLQGGKIGDRLFLRNHVAFYFTIVNAKKEPDLLKNKPLQYYDVEEAKAILAAMLEIVTYLGKQDCEDVIVGIQSVYFPLDDERKWYGHVEFYLY